MSSNRLAKFAWFVVGYNILVILWGAFVRASGSGAGCGEHWPLCNGEVVPLNPDIERVIEFTHRVMSGIDLPLVLLLAFFVFRAFPWGRVRYAMLASVLFLIVEALVGALLVRQGLVADDRSPERAFWVAAHLANTFLLLASMSLTAWWIGHDNALEWRGRPLTLVALGIALIGILLTGMSGAVTALGDTLFPASSLAEGLLQDVDPASHFLIQLRVIHPLIAIGVGAYILFLTIFLTNPQLPESRKLALVLRFLVAGQLILGAINVALLVPMWAQITHLLVADLLWIALLLFGVSLLSVATESQNAPALETASAPAVS
jgi:heme A synthase